jgi:4-hydroxy-4-methyl-2-oxoglutarate aldolase
VNELLELGAATLGESGARHMAPRVRAVWPGAAVCGPAFTAVCGRGDNLAVHVAVAEAPPGSVLCVEVGSQRELGWWGEVLTTAAQARGLAGLVIDACVRDVDALERLGFAVFSTGIALPGAVKVGPGMIGGPADVGDALVEPGDTIVGDRDGVVVIPNGSYDDVLAAGRRRAEAEAVMFERLRDGATTVELLGLDGSRVERH